MSAADKTKLNAIGTVVTKTNDYTAIPTGISTKDTSALCSVSLSPGKWVVIGRVQFPSNSTGLRIVNIAMTKGSNWAQQSQNACDGTVTAMVVAAILTVESTTTYWLNAQHTASNVMLVMNEGTSSLTAIKISN